MPISRRKLLTGGLFGVALLLAGCTTPAIESRHYYTEKVSSILISQDKQKIVFIGKPYHYIFDAPAGIVATVERPFHAKVSGELSEFHVDVNGNVSGVYSLQVAGDLSGQDAADATAAGYWRDAKGQLTLSGKLSGMRYEEDTSLVGAIKALNNPKPSVDEKSAAPETLNRTYTIVVTYDPSNGEKAADKLISPIIVTSDGLFLLFNVVLAPVVIPMAVTKVSPDCVPYCMSTFK